MKIAGIIIIAFGLVDLIGSYTDFDLWGGFIGVDLPEVLWKYSSYIEIALGYFLMNMGSKDTETDAAVE
jgi:hypothetical protein